MLHALQRFKVHDWDRNKDFLPVQVEGKQCHESKIRDNDLETVDLLLHTSHDERVTDYGLQGRAINVVSVTSEALAKKYPNPQDGMVAKIFWGEEGRNSEPKIFDKVEQIANVHPTVQGHIPELPWHHWVDESHVRHTKYSVSQNPPRAVACSTSLYSGSSIPSRSFTAKSFLMSGVNVSYHTSHLTLWKEGVYNRDITPRNLMWYRKTGKLIGVLNDYDLSSLADDPGLRGNERTGTVPFMALDLLTAKAQRGEGVLLPGKSRLLDEWATLDAIPYGKEKLFFLFDCFSYQPPDLQTSQSDIGWSLWDLLMDCFKVLDTDAYNRRSRIRHLRRVQQRLMEGSGEQLDAKETIADMDHMLGKFTGSMAWVKLSNLSAPQ
ncbi:uncharacterized protein EDB93DRAFT_1254386 [Suillus bovinus]|uniref:uncharacterized protein n=1 Tax=Suillus bovinus TaxID=48563 RepID=UPI001B873838|nr:uncharacterized protein EDB93DRAFT_1254386 [Suillus bovinus]KAG2134882.1 hypothetical protein EDB93DRAFT_1254386 [Suillus bovinus]